MAYDGQEMRAKLRSLYLSGKKPTANQIKYLVAASIDDKSLIKLTDPFKYGSTLLHWCAIFSLVQEGKILLELGANPRAKNNVYRMPHEYCTNSDLRKPLDNPTIV